MKANAKTDTVDLDVQDDGGQDTAPLPDQPIPPQGEKSQGRKKRSPKGEPATFARRLRPKTRPAETKFLACRDIFRQHVAPKLDAMEEGRCFWEARAGMG